MKKAIVAVSFLTLTLKSYSQKWTEMMQEPGRNFYEIQQAFNDYFKEHDNTIKGIGYKQFKRWENFMAPRVYPSGDLSVVSNNWENFKAFKRQNIITAGKSSASAVGTWTAMGPMGPPTGSVNGTPTKTGRDNFITFHPSNSNAFWVGAAAGGLWATTNGGSSWNTTTDYLASIGCSDLAVDPTNPNIMYLATGDGEAGDTYCIGVLKSTDGGLTWNSTGLSFPVSQMRQMRRLIINPSNPQILLAATNVGAYRTIDGGVNWTSVSGGNFYDLEFKPGDPTIVYLAGTILRKSTDAGATFTTISNGIPTSGAVRMNIAVTPADPTYVYVLRALASTNGYGGLYRSTDSGNTFSTMSSSPDMLSNPCNASGSNAQGWYDLSCAASPTNVNEVVIGGVNVWKSTNGGTSFTNIGCWNSPGPNPPFIHADIHELEYTSAGILYATADGGVFNYTGTSWTDLTAPRNISQIYRIGLSSLTPNLWLCGLQDNGSIKNLNGAYNFVTGGDGMDCFIDRTNDNNMFCSSQNGSFRRSNNGGASWSGFTAGLTGTGPWLSPWKQDPVNASLFYAGYQQMFVSNGGAWSQLTNTGGSGDIIEFAIAKSNNQVIYVIHGTSIRKTTDAGVTWTNVSSGIPGSAAAPTYITIDPSNENVAWVTCSGYSAGNKVFQTVNGGATWVNISFNLPNIPANCVVCQPSTNGRVYVGMDVGVYTKDNSSSIWTLYNTSLPNTPVFELAISPAAPTLLRAATHGRGVYETELIQPTTIPATSFTTSGVICSGLSKNFMDLSSEAPSSWSWSVSPASGVAISSSTVQNPAITFPSAGSYTVSMVSANAFGSGTTAVQTVTVAATPVLTLTSSGASETVCVNENITLTASGANTYTWLPGPVNGSTLNFIADLTVAGIYTVNGKSLEGCTDTETLSLVVSECIGIDKNSLAVNAFEVYPNPANTYVNIKSNHKANCDLDIYVTDVSGKLVMQQKLHFKKDKYEQQLNISALANGVYLVKIKVEGGASQQLKLVKE